MTIRFVINKKRRTLSILIYIGFALFFAGTLSAEYLNLKGLLIAGLIGFAIAGIGIIYALFGISCPKCGNSWRYLATSSGNPFSISKKIRFCPYCGTDVDSDLDRG
jgi:endogenous inhibitor of DNA gyrase (YacG/DUF329 family)